MRNLRKDLRHYIDLRRALGYKLRKHEARLTEFIAFLEEQGTDRITTKLAIAWATESSNGHKHSCFERLGFIRSFAKHVSSMDARMEILPTGTMRRPEIALRPYIYTQEEIGRSWQQRAICFHRVSFGATRTIIWSDCWQRPVCAAAKRFGS
jgi:integrase/recombinase XerD